MFQGNLRKIYLLMYIQYNVFYTIFLIYDIEYYVSTIYAMLENHESYL